MIPGGIPTDAGALEDLRVVEVAQGTAGPLCGKALADLGADVIKVEPLTGDRSRRIGPFPNSKPHPERSGQFLYNNTNKRSVALDLEAEAHRQRLCDLVRDADVLILDLSPARISDWRLNYEGLKKLNDQLIVTCISPFGQDGPYRDYKATELTSFCVGGLGRETPHNQVTDPEKEPPLKAGGYQASYLTGWTAATATMVALHHRAAYGLGQLVDIAEMEAAANMLRYSFAAASHDPVRVSPRFKVGYPWILPCKDGHVSFSPFQFDHWWESFREMMGDPDWASVEIFSTLRGRLEHADVIEKLTIEWMSQHTKQEIYAMALARGMPGFPVHTIAEVVASKQFAARNFFVEIDHPEAGKLKQPGAHCRYHKTPWRIATAAPRLGQDNHSVFTAAEDGTCWHTPRVTPARLAARSGGTGASAGPLNNKPLKGIRVAEFGWVLAVPHATAWLACLGAEVIRIESNRRLDLVRLSPAGAADGIPGVNRSGFFNGLNYAKKSITLDLTQPEGVALAKQIVAESDIVTENFSVGVMDKVGLGYEAIRAVKPDIIMLSASPLGSDGPERLATGWGPNTQAYAGLPHITGYEGGPPSGIGGNWPDYMIGVAMAFSLLAALHHRTRTGEGQLLEVSMAELVATMLPEAILDYTMNGRKWGRIGNTDHHMAPHGVYRCQGDDAWAAIAVQSDDEWLCLRQALGNPAWAADPALDHLQARLARQAEIDAHLTTWTKQRSPYQVMHHLQKAGIAAAPCLDVFELMKDPQLTHRRFLIELPHPEIGPRTVAGLPGLFSAMSSFAYSRAPLLGEHNHDIFCDLLGLSEEQFAALCETKVVY